MLDLLNFLPFDKDGSINVLGYKLHTDDLLILAIMLFLYIEKTGNMFLFIFLALLLFS